jgi:hypothetical protein
MNKKRFRFDYDVKNATLSSEIAKQKINIFNSMPEIEGQERLELVNYLKRDLRERLSPFWEEAQMKFDPREFEMIEQRADFLSRWAVMFMPVKGTDQSGDYTLRDFPYFRSSVYAEMRQVLLDRSRKRFATSPLPQDEALACSRALCAGTSMMVTHLMTQLIGGDEWRGNCANMADVSHYYFELVSETADLFQAILVRVFLEYTMCLEQEIVAFSAEQAWISQIEFSGLTSEQVKRVTDRWASVLS